MRRAAGSGARAALKCSALRKQAFEEAAVNAQTGIPVDQRLYQALRMKIPFDPSPAGCESAV